jgi:hypothetical protein
MDKNLMMRRILPFFALTLLASCGSPNDPGVGGVSKAEAEQLNEAAQLLNQDKPPPSLAEDAQSSVPLPPGEKD